MNRHGLSRQRYAEMMALEQLQTNQKEAYYRQHFGTGEAGLTTILNIAKSIASKHHITEKEANQLLPLFPQSSKGDLDNLIKQVNDSGMPRERFLEILTSSGGQGQVGLHDAIRISDRWNSLNVQEDVNNYLDKKHAHEPEQKITPIGAKADASAIGSDAHRMEVRQAIGNMMNYNQGKSAPKSQAEELARVARGSALEGNSVQRQIAEAFERRASPNYQAPEHDSIRDHLESAFDNKIADVAEREEFGTERGIPANEGEL